MATPHALPSLQSSVLISALPSEGDLSINTDNGSSTPPYTRDTGVSVVNPATPQRNESPPRRIGVLRRKADAIGKSATARAAKLAIGFLHWLHYVWLDVLGMLLILAVMYICLRCLPIFRFEHRAFPVRLNVFTLRWEAPLELSYPIMDFIFPVIPLGVLLPVIAIFIFAVMQIWVRNVWDFTAAVLGMLKGLIGM